MKKKIASIILAVCTLCGNTMAMAETAPTVMINGEKVEASAIIRDDKTYVPVRGVFEKMGCTVEWNGETKTAGIDYKNKRIEFYANNYDPNVLIIDGRMYVPLRYVVDSTLLGDIEWQEDTKTVVINTDTAKEAELSVIDNESGFAVRFNELMPKDKNYMFSPLSLKYALAMAANGADEETVKEITKVLGIDNIDQYNDEVKEYLNEKQLKKFDNDGGFYGFGLNVANSIWLNEDYVKGGDFSDRFKKIIEEKYNGTAQMVNNENAVKTINDWCAEKTNNRVPEIIEDSNFQSCLVNTVYFIGRWSAAFNEELTKKDIFTDRNKKESEIDFMNGVEWDINYYEDSNIKIIELPYNEGNLSMYIALTEKENVDFEKYVDKMKEERVNLSIPKFKTEYSLSAVDILSELGIKSPFDKNSNHFKRMFNDKVNETFDDNMFISDILQKTFIEVDEEGTEAGAVTVITEVGSLDEPIKEKIYEFKADRPFTYFIRDNKTGDILFMGEYAFAE